MELKYIDVVYTLRSYNVNYCVEWLSEDRFKVSVNQDSAIIEPSTVNAPFPIINGPRRRLPTNFTKLHQFTFVDDDEEEIFDLEFKNDTYIESQESSYECYQGVKIRIDENPFVNEYIVDNCVRIRSPKWSSFQTKYGIEVVDTVLEIQDLTDNYNLAKFMLWFEGSIYTQYFSFHKPNELIGLNRLNIHEDENSVSVPYTSINALSKRSSGTTFENNLILKSVGFVRDGQRCRCPLSKWNEYRKFMGCSVVGEESMIGTSYPHQGLYLLQLNCDHGTNKYKLGKAQDLLRRLKSTEYRNAFIICTSMSKDIDKCERELINEFNKRFVNVKNSDAGGFGAEMFMGNIYDMIDLFWSVCAKWR